MRTDLPKKHNTRSKDQPLKERVCCFPDCGERFMGRGKTKYCDEHRKPEYRSALYSKPKGESIIKDHSGNFIHIDEVNLFIKHSYVEAHKFVQVCECCGETYPITVIPGQFTYPKYCQEHRNEYKRNRYLKTNGLV
jgi:hypothetical protein